MILNADDFDKYAKVQIEVKKKETYWLGLGDLEYQKRYRSLNVLESELPIGANVLIEIKDILILEVAIQVCLGKIGQNVQAVAQDIVVDPWKLQLDQYRLEKTTSMALVGKEHFIDGAEEFDAYTSRVTW